MRFWLVASVRATASSYQVAVTLPWAGFSVAAARSSASANVVRNTPRPPNATAVPPLPRLQATPLPEAGADASRTPAGSRTPGAPPTPGAAVTTGAGGRNCRSMAASRALASLRSPFSAGALSRNVRRCASVSARLPAICCATAALNSNATRSGASVSALRYRCAASLPSPVRSAWSPSSTLASTLPRTTSSPYFVPLACSSGSIPAWARNCRQCSGALSGWPPSCSARAAANRLACLPGCVRQASRYRLAARA